MQAESCHLPSNGGSSGDSWEGKCRFPWTHLQEYAMSAFFVKFSSLQFQRGFSASHSNPMHKEKECAGASISPYLIDFRTTATHDAAETMSSSSEDCSSMTSSSCPASPTYKTLMARPIKVHSITPFLILSGQIPQRRTHRRGLPLNHFDQFSYGRRSGF
jgi:hypothetical protein